MRDRVLMVTSKFHGAAEGPYLTNELAMASSELGSEVDVLCLPWSGRAGFDVGVTRVAKGVTVFVPRLPKRFRASGKAASILRWGLAPWYALPLALRLMRQRGYKKVLMFSPCSSMVPLVLLLTSFEDCWSSLYITDFFPIHWQALGRLRPRAISWILFRLESFLVRRFSAVACMTARGSEFASDYFKIAAPQTSSIVPLWTSHLPFTPMSREGLRADLGLDREARVLVFGGQLIAGRGLEDLVDALDIVRSQQPNVSLLILGTGPLRQWIEQIAGSGSRGVIVRDPLPRSEYLRVASACDVGMVATVPGVPSPTFPSKTLDYLLAGIPVVGSVEKATDYHDYVRRTRIGLTVVAGNPNELAKAVIEVLATAESRNVFGSRALRVLREEHSPHDAARRLTMPLGA